jgi:hypothetical protein
MQLTVAIRREIDQVDWRYFHSFHRPTTVSISSVILSRALFAQVKDLLLVVGQLTAGFYLITADCFLPLRCHSERA